MRHGPLLPRHPILGAALLVLLMVSGLAARAAQAPAGEASAGDKVISEADYARVNAALLDHYIVPRYTRLADAADDLNGTVRAFCDRADDRDLAAVRAGYQATMDAWMGIAHLRFGPVELFMRAFRIYFWPEGRGRVTGAVDALLAAGEPGALSGARLADASVAAQGLPALEYLLYTDPALRQDGARAATRCTLATGIAGNLVAMADRIVAEWRGESGEFRASFLHPGPDNAWFQTHREATLALFKSFYGGLQRIVDFKLLPPLGDSLEAAQPNLVESRASGRALRNIALNLEALQALYDGAGGAGLGTLARSSATDPELDALLRKALRMTRDKARALDPSLAGAVADPARRPEVEMLSTWVRALKQIVRERLAPALGLSVGFNAMDGD